MYKIIIMICLVMISPLFAQSEYRAGDHELLLMPTAETMPKGQWYFTDYELFVLNFTTAVTPRTHVSALFLFPVTKEFLETFSFGVKQNYLRTEKLGAAVWASYTPKVEALTIGNVFSIPFGVSSAHFAVGAATGREATKWEFVFLAGMRHDLSSRTSLIAEYANTNSAIEEDFNGMISLGLRFHGKSMAWEIAAIRPLTDTGSLLFLPLLKATVLL